jgi:hypothetical protein
VKGESRLARGTVRSGIIASAAAAAALALAGLYRGNNPDTFGHLAQGRQIASLGRVPALDTWSLLPGSARPWHNYEWLSDLGTWLAYQTLGYPAVTLFKCGLLAIAALCLVTTARRAGGAAAATLTCLTLISTIPAIRARLSDRPHVLGIALAAAYLLLLTSLGTQTAEPTQRRRGTLLVAALFVLHVVWINAHGSHLLGVLMTLSFLVLSAPTARRWLACALAAQLVASCCSPYGPAIVLDAVEHVVDARYRSLVSEWLPWQEHDPVWLQLGPALHGTLLTLCAPHSWRRAPALRAMLPVALVLGAACFRSIRFLAEFMLLTSPLVGVGGSAYLATLPPRFLRYLVPACAVLLAVLVPLGAAQLPPKLGISTGLSYDGTPRAAGSLLARHGVAPRVFASMQDSWFTMFAAPKSRFAIDGRVPFYGPDYVQGIQRAFAEREAFRQLTRALDVDVVIASHTVVGEQQVRGYVARDPAWSLVMIEDLHATYVRTGALDARGAERYPRLHQLQPDYDMSWILSAAAEPSDELERELERMRREPGTSGYLGWVEGILTLAPLRRGGASDGFRWPRDEHDWALYRRARPSIAEAALHVADVPVVMALHAALNAVFCDFSTATRAVDHALGDQPSREPLLAAQEIKLRQGRADEVRQVVTAARALPEGRADPWLAELASGLDNAPACPP